jgi:Zn-dependent alcohol dehydrogenase
MPTDHTFRHHTADGQNLGHVSKIGAFAEHTVVSADSIVKVDPHLPLIPAALLACAIPNGYGSAVHRANVREGDTVVVVGTGGIGTAALQGARINGALCIVAVEPVEFKRAARACSPGCRHDRSGRSTSTCNPRSDIAMLAGLYQSGKLRLDEMVTKRYRLDEINDAYADLKNGELIRGVIDFGIS